MVQLWQPQGVVRLAAGPSSRAYAVVRTPHSLASQRREANIIEKSRQISDLEAFSHNSSDGSFEPLPDRAGPIPNV